MKALKWLLIVIVLIVLTAVGIGFILKDKTLVERSIVVNARPATVYAVLSGYRHFNKWSPWAKLDPNTQYSLEGPVTGIGAKQSWSSADPNVGAGSQEITAITPNQSVTQKVMFSDFNTDNTSTYTLSPEGEGTRVTWSFEMSCGGDVMCRYMGLAMDGMLGPEYESGLLNLQAFVETLPKDDFTTLQIEVVQTQPVTIAYTYGETTADQAAARLGELYGKITKVMQAGGAQQIDAPMAITHSFDEAALLWKFDAAIPIDNSGLAPPPESEVKVMQTYAGTAIKAVHKGAYAAMQPTYAKLIAYKIAMGYEDNGNSWEHYVTDPGKTAEADLVTNIYWPVK